MIAWKKFMLPSEVLDRIHAQHPNFVFALDPQVLKQGDLFFEILPSIYVLMGWYDETP